MDNASLLTEAAVLTQVNKWVGVIIAFVAALVVAPDGTRLLLSRSATWVRSQIDRYRRPREKVIQIGAVGEGSTLGSLSVTLTGHAWRPDDPVDDRIEALRAYIVDVESRLNQAKQEIAQERSAREEAIAELTAIFQAKLEELHQLLKEKDQRTATINARAIPVIGAGIFLNGVPEALAQIPLHLGWMLPFLGFGAMVAALVGARRSPA
ncbi:hypothetical protein ACU635_53360 [[Actinomadura] parvosata]|uniref:hypothetical protein n=1 Tax=[Actinomadura] parvosata TaxID=1955412 RepID=UPI00406D2627